MGNQPPGYGRAGAGLVFLAGMRAKRLNRTRIQAVWHRGRFAILAAGALSVALAACAPWPVQRPVTGPASVPSPVASPQAPNFPPSSPIASAASSAPAAVTAASPSPGSVSNGPAAATQTSVAAASLSTDIVDLAEDQLGVPYHYGGITPRGFDCSGLVYYVFRQLGLTVPRTANAQKAASLPVTKADLEPGDLVFFRIAGEMQLHVGIYTGEGEFIHAPKPGQKVSYAKLDARYWKRRYVGAGRFERG